MSQNKTELHQYIGTKIINARPMNRQEYNNYRGWQVPEDEDPTDEGYLVEYVNSPTTNMPHGHTNYISWSPKKEFDEAYRRTDGLTFGLALEALKKGLPIARNGWNGKNMFVFKQVPANIGPDIIPKMQSVPQSVKDIIMGRSKPLLAYENQAVIVKPDGTVDNWSPSISDCFSDDWFIVR